MGSGGETAVRAGNARDTIAFLDSYQEGLKAKVEARMAPGVMQKMVETPRTGWIPLSVDRQFVDALVEELGPDGAVKLIRASVSTHFNSALLRTLVQGAKIFGAGPRGLYKLLPRGWSLVYRGMGTPIALPEPSDTQAINFELLEAPQLVLESPGYTASFEAILQGILDVSKVDGIVESWTDIEQQRWCARARWSN